MFCKPQSIKAERLLATFSVYWELAVTTAMQLWFTVEKTYPAKSAVRQLKRLNWADDRPTIAQIVKSDCFSSI